MSSAELPAGPLQDSGRSQFMPLPTSPVILLAFASVGLIIGRTFRPAAGRFWGIYCLTAVFVTGVDLFADPLRQFHAQSQGSSETAWVHDSLAGAEQWVVLAFGLLTSLSLFDSHRYLKASSGSPGFILFALAGLMLVAGANDAIALELSLEIISVTVIALLRSCRSGSGRGTQGQVNYAWFAAMASGLVWLGIAFLANSLATTHYEQIRTILIDAYDPGGNREPIGAPSKLVLLSTGLIVAGLLARMGMAPFQFQWTSLARHESLCIAGFLMQAGLLAGSFALCRLLGLVFAGVGQMLLPLVIVFSLATLAITCLLSLSGFSPGAKSIPRWLVCLVLFEGAMTGLGLMTVTSELEHPGARWGAFLAGHESISLIVYGQLAFLFAFSGFYFTLELLSRGNRGVEFLEDIQGLGRVAPVLAATMMVTLVSVVGCPLTAGFWSRWETLLCAANAHVKSTTSIYSPQTGLRFLMVVAIVTACCLTVFVASIARQLFLELPLARPVMGRQRGLFSASLISGLAVLTLGIAPDVVLKPLESISSPRAVPPVVPSRGSGKNSVGWNRPGGQVRRIEAAK